MNRKNLTTSPALRAVFAGLALLLAFPALAEEETVIDDAPVAASKVQDHALPGGKTDDVLSGFAAELNRNYENFDPAPYAEQIKEVEDYLSSFTTLESRFSQTTSETAIIVQGTLQISRPGKMHLEYLRPDRMDIVVNGRNMRYYDAKLDQVSYGILPDSPFEILLYNKVTFSGSTRVVDVQEDSSSLSLTIKPLGKDTALLQTFMAMTLVFDKNPMTLKRIIRTDSQNQALTVYLLDTQLDPPLDDALFDLKNPTQKKRKN